MCKNGKYTHTGWKIARVAIKVADLFGKVHLSQYRASCLRKRLTVLENYRANLMKEQ